MLYSPSTNQQTSVSKKAEGLVEGDKLVSTPLQLAA
jgi:hypothetical protein